MESITSNTHVVLWGPFDKRFSIETLGEYIHKNQVEYLCGEATVCVILAFATSVDHAGKLIDKFKAKKQKMENK